MSGSSEADEPLQAYLSVYYEEWLPFLAIAVHYGPPESDETLYDYQQLLYKECYFDWSCKEILENLQSGHETFSRMFEAKRVLKEFVNGAVPSLIVSYGPHMVLQALHVTDSTPVGYVADLLQAVLAMFSYETARCCIPVLGYVAVGVVVGSLLGRAQGGAVGTVIGVAVGLWGLVNSISSQVNEALVVQIEENLSPLSIALQNYTDFL